MDNRTSGQVIVLALLMALMMAACGSAPAQEDPTPGAEARAWFESQGKQVLTFVGYSGAGYEDEAAMLRVAEDVLSAWKPAETIVNIGATADGIGAVYALARRLGFTTTGIVSTQAKKYEATISPDVDHVFFIEDETWGGFQEGTSELNPTSRVMVDVSTKVVGIGGGAVGRDELLAARSQGKFLRFIPADMNRGRAVAKAAKKRLPAPTDFHGEAHAEFGSPKTD